MRLDGLLPIALIALTAAAAWLLGPVGAIAPVLLLLALVGLSVVIGSGSSRPRRIAAPEQAGGAALTLADHGMRNIFVAALALRLFLAVLLNVTGLSRELAPDSYGYTIWGKYIAMSWDNPAIDPSVVRGYKELSFYQHLNGAVTYLLGGMSPALVLSLINAVLGTLVAWLIGKVAGNLFGPVAQRRTFLLAAFLPSLVLWSSINMRDVWNWLLVVATIIAAQKLRQRFELKSVLMLGVCLALLPLIRSYMLVLVGLALCLSFLVVRFKNLPVTLLAFALVAGILIMFGESFNLGLDMDLDERLELMNRMKRGLSGGSAAYYRDVDISTPAGALSYLPIGTTIFLFAPFPWSPDNLRQAVAVPETMFWYVVFFQGMRALWTLRRTIVLRAGPVFFTCFVMLFAYGLVEGNEGTAYRHRATVMLLFFVFAGADAALRARRTEPERSKVVPAPKNPAAVSA